MKKQDLAARLARKARLSRAAAADHLDRFIHDVIAELRSGNPVSLPGPGNDHSRKEVDLQVRTAGIQERPSP